MSFEHLLTCIGVLGDTMSDCPTILIVYVVFSSIFRNFFGSHASPLVKEPIFGQYCMAIFYVSIVCNGSCKILLFLSFSTTIPTFYNWDHGDPNDGGQLHNEDCALIKPDGKWNDYPCEDRFNYICKSKPCKKSIFFGG